MLINEQIDTMPAGAEVNALVAERVMGWQGVHIQHDLLGYVTGVYGYPPCPPVRVPSDEPYKTKISTISPYSAAVPSYSTAIAAAWLVVEKLRDSDQLESIALGNWEDSRWTKWVVTLRCFADDQDGRGETAPLAICRAALKAAALATK